VILSPFEGGYRGMKRVRIQFTPLIPPPAGDSVMDEIKIRE